MSKFLSINVRKFTTLTYQPKIKFLGKRSAVALEKKLNEAIRIEEIPRRPAGIKMATFPPEPEIKMATFPPEPEIKMATFPPEPEIKMATFPPEPEIKMATFPPEPIVEAKTVKYDLPTMNCLKLRPLISQQEMDIINNGGPTTFKDWSKVKVKPKIKLAKI